MWPTSIVIAACTSGIFIHVYYPKPGQGSSIPSYGLSGGRDSHSGVKIKKER